MSQKEEEEEEDGKEEEGKEREEEKEEGELQVLYPIKAFCPLLRVFLCNPVSYLCNLDLIIFHMLGLLRD